jgi:hypothetical protein
MVWAMVFSFWMLVIRRPFKKLLPVLGLHRQLLEDFLKRFWAYYDQLLAYRQAPTAEDCVQLEAGFDDLFSTHTGYDDLDQRSTKTHAKKASLLLVLKFPELPLHNNASELGVRQRERKRDVNFGPRTPSWVRAPGIRLLRWQQSLKNLGVSFYRYLHDRISAENQIPTLANLVEKRAKELNLGRSWADT